jgi:chromosome partitioning protein
MGNIIVIANQKGGVGKTTTAVNLSACIAALGKRVLLVDIDPQGNACSGFGIVKEKNTNGIYEVLMQTTDIHDVIKTISKFNLDIIPVDMNLSGAQVELVNEMARESRLKDALRNIRNEYDYIFIDCPPSLGLLTVNGLVAADSVLIPLQCEFYALEGLSQLLKTVSLVQKRLNSGLKILGVVFTMYDSRTNLSGQVVEDVMKYFKEKAFKTIIPRNVKLSEAPSFGIPIHMYDTNSLGAKSYIQLAKEVIERG